MAPLTATSAALILLFTSLTSVNAAVALYGQCGGQNYSGETVCVSGAYCRYQDQWYSQCLPGTATTTPGGGGGTTTVRPTTTAPGGTQTGLSTRFKAKGKQYFGTATDKGLLSGSTHANTIIREFGAVTPENSMKWDAVEKSKGVFSFGDSDYLVSWAQSNGKLVRGHTLVWHSQLPSWVSSISSKTEIESVMKNHIASVAGHFKGKIFHWDVVNEIFNENGSFRSSVFYDLLGEGFVATAFNAAKAADGSAKLYINDYNLDSNNAKAQAVVNLVKKLKTAGVPVDGIGTQAHLEANGAGGVKAALTLLASAGVDVAITELDIKNASANDYTTVVNACLTTPACVGITVWGVSDKDSWRSGNNPLLFDGNYQAKAAYNAVIGLL